MHKCSNAQMHKCQYLFHSPAVLCRPHNVLCASFFCGDVTKCIVVEIVVACALPNIVIDLDSGPRTHDQTFLLLVVPNANRSNRNVSINVNVNVNGNVNGGIGCERTRYRKKMSNVKCQMPKCQMPNVKCQMHKGTKPQPNTNAQMQDAPNAQIHKCENAQMHTNLQKCTNPQNAQIHKCTKKIQTPNSNF